jgi:N-methylhydantoinase A
MAYGGSGPLHMAGYTRGLPFKGVVTFPFAAGFSAFGCAAMDYTHRYSRSVLLATSGEGNGDASAGRVELAEEIDQIWSEFERQALEEFELEGMDAGAATVVPFAMMRYGGQLFDVEVPYAGRRPLGDSKGLQDLLDTFEQVYDAINSRVARHPEAGMEIHELGILASIPTVKPVLNKNPLGPAPPSDEAYKGTRQIYRGGDWTDATLWEMDLLRPGNRLEGPAIVEHPATTLVVPEGQHVQVDEWSFLWLRDS